MYTRVEFRTDVGFGPTVAAFVRFDAKGISFGAPYHIQVCTGRPEEGGRLIHEYQRVTVHVDGRVETHLLFPSPDVTQSDQDQPRLSEWDEPWSRHFEFTWSPDDLPFIKTWFTKPKPETDTTCLGVPVDFVAGALRSIVTICVATPERVASGVVPVVPPEDGVWRLTAGWPWVVVAISNVRDPKTETLSTVGRDYR